MGDAMSKLKPLMLLVGVLAGLTFAGLTIVAAIHGAEHRVALAMLVGIALLAVFAAPDAPKRNAFASGFLIALVAVLTQAAFLPVYFENNPSYQLVEIPFGLSARSYIMLFAPLGAAVAGAMTTAVAWVAAVIFLRNK